MTPSEYSAAAMRTDSPHYDPNCMDPRLQHAILGIVTEAGELADVLKRGTFYGRGKEAVSLVDIREELGDLLWYVALAASATGTTFEALMASNISKLRVRYPDKFTTADAQHRDVAAERTALSQENP